MHLKLRNKIGIAEGKALTSGEISEQMVDREMTVVWLMEVSFIKSPNYGQVKRLRPYVDNADCGVRFVCRS
jgi:hypothetical protein